MDNLTWWIYLIITLAAIFYIVIHKRWRRTLFSTENKAIIITGCDSGIGLQAAIVFHNLGFTVFAGCLLFTGEGASHLRQVSSDRIKVLDLDVTDKVKVNEAVKYVEQFCKLNNLSVWCLINNAGICVGGDVEWQTLEQCEKQVNVNFLGMVKMVKAFLPLIKLSKGRIINVSSVNGRWTYPKFSIYCATKFAIEGFSDGLRVELSRHGVQVVVVAPGDHARITNIMRYQKERAKEQWDSFSQSFRDEVGDEFWTIQSQMCAKAGLTSFTDFKQSPVFKDLTSAVMEPKPKTHYISTSLKYRIFFFILRNLPTSMSDYLLHKVQEGITNCQVESIRPN